MQLKFHNLNSFLNHNFLFANLELSLNKLHMLLMGHGFIIELTPTVLSLNKGSDVLP